MALVDTQHDCSNRMMRSYASATRPHSCQCISIRPSVRQPNRLIIVFIIIQLKEFLLTAGFSHRVLVATSVCCSYNSPLLPCFVRKHQTSFRTLAEAYNTNRNAQRKSEKEFTPMFLSPIESRI